MGYGTLGQKDFVRIPADQAVAVRQDLEKAPRAVAESSHPEGRSHGTEDGGKTLASTGSATSDAVEGLEPYVIGPGETLSEIASQFGLSTTKLIDLNDIQNPKRVRAGQKILVPKAK
jgi:LysM repeat protein